MSEPSTLAEVMSVQGHRIRMTIRQWLHISENHDYMAGNRALVLEAIADPDALLAGRTGETLALRAYAHRNWALARGSYAASAAVEETLPRL